MKNRRGLTLVELLAVIAIIGVLLALLLPGVQAAREAARRSACANNMRQLGQGLHQFHAARGSLPVTVADGSIYNSAMDPTFGRYKASLAAATGSGVYCVYNWVVGVLPFVEQQAFFGMFDLKGKSDNSTNKPLVQTPLPIIICPSDQDSAAPILTRRGFTATSYGSSTDADGNAIHGLWYAGSAGPSAEFGGNQLCPGGSSEWCWITTTFPIGASTVLDIGNKVGMFGARWFPTRFDDAQDGLSNTFLLVETQPKFSPHNAAYPSFSGNGMANPVITLSAPINVPIPSTASPFLNPAGQYNGSFAIYAKSPRSAHPGGCQMLMCDGAVVFFSEQTPLQLLCRLGNRKDGEIAIVP